MEPFGLFQFLQSLLNSPSNNATPPTEETAPTAAPVQKSEPSDERSPDKQPPALDNKNGEAYLRFISDHEKRTRNTRKK